MTPSGPPRTVLLWHERFAWYEAGIGAGFAPAGGLVQPYEAVDAPAAKARLRSLVDVSGLAASLRIESAGPAGEEDLLAFHDADYLERLRRLDAAGSGDAGSMAPVGPDAYLTARLAVGCSLAAVDEVLAGRAANAYALVRPPGHHARRGEGLGSCLLANAVLAAERARRRHGAERIAIVDWDVHHGNGAQEAFWDDPDVLTISLHQDGYFPPGSGALEELGGPAAAGTNLNLPLPPGSGHRAYLQLARQVVAPALRAHRPDLVILCSGYDAAVMDPMGRMLLHSESFRQLTAIVDEVAEEVCGGRLVAIQEGGYSPAYTPFCGVAVIEELAGVRVCEDPFIEVFEPMPGQDSVPPRVAELEAAALSRGPAPRR